MALAFEGLVALHFLSISQSYAKRRVGKLGFGIPMIDTHMS